MPQTIHRGIKALIDEANAEIETISAADCVKLASDEGIVIVDIRDPREIERDGRIPGAFSCTRGMPIRHDRSASTLPKLPRISMPRVS